MSNDQRTTYRCASTPGLQAVLRVRGRDIIVVLGDQSAGGLAVEFDGRLKAKVGETVHVRTCNGWTEATVIHHQIGDGTTRLGLERVEELPDPREPVWSLQSVESRQPLASRQPVESRQPGKSRRSLGLLAAVVVISFGCQMLTAGWFPGNGQALPVHEILSDLLGKTSRAAPSPVRSQ